MMIRELTAVAASASCLLVASSVLGAPPASSPRAASSGSAASRSGSVAGSASTSEPVSASAASAGPVQGGISIAAFLGYGSGGSTNAYGLGGGFRVGYTMPFPKARVYLGGSITWHKGTSSPQFGLDVTNNVWYLGALEAGYDFGIGPVLVRPYVGLGPAITSAQTGNVVNSVTNFGVWPGVTALLASRHWIAGLDARFIVNAGNNGPALFATGGVRF